MPQLKSNKKTFLWLICLLFLFLLGSYWVRPMDTVKTYPDYVSHSPSPTGIKALYTYLEQESGAVSRWNQHPDRLGTQEHNQILMMVEPTKFPNKEEIQAYESFMETGNTILLFKVNPTGIFDVKSAYVQTEPLDEAIKLNSINDRTYLATVSSEVRLDTNSEDSILLYDEQGTIAFQRPYGNGSLIVVNAPEWVTNDAILKHDHLAIIFTLLQEKHPSTIIFDEYVHSSLEDNSVTDLYPQWFLLLIAQGALLTVFLLWNRGKRFGPILHPREETVRFSDEGLRALAAWYIRGSRYQDSLAIQSDYVRQILQERWGLAYHRDWLDLTDQLERKWKGAKNSDIRPFLQGLTNVLAKEQLSKKEYLFWSKKLDVLRKEVEEG